jgi:hypothetical protein
MKPAKDILQQCPLRKVIASVKSSAPELLA